MILIFYVSVRVCIWVWFYGCSCLCRCGYVDIYVCVCGCMCVNVGVGVWMDVCVCGYRCGCDDVCVYKCVCMCVCWYLSSHEDFACKTFQSSILFHIISSVMRYTVYSNYLQFRLFYCPIVPFLFLHFTNSSIFLLISKV